jgi:amino acid adenylation domain-containing protein
MCYKWARTSKWMPEVESANPELNTEHMSTLAAGAKPAPSILIGEVVDFPANSTIHALVEATVDRSPDAVAVEIGEVRLTYRELESRANQLAAYLLSCGVNVEDRVGVHLERSLDMVIAIFAILKAGAAYVPLDPAYPPQRLEMLALDAEPRAIVTRRSLSDGFPECDAWRVEIDTHAEEIRHQNRERGGARGDAGSLAYVLYTSGTSGSPNGVMIEHRALCNFIWQVLRLHGVCPGDRLLQFASLNFDSSVSDIFRALVGGATLCLLEPERLQALGDLVGFLKERRVTKASLPPAVLSLLDPGELSHLGLVVSGGDRCSWDLVQRWGRGRRFLNAYGPTEATVAATVHECNPAQVGGAVAIGTPLGNYRVYLLDEGGTPVPRGATGEIVIGGASVARGYLGRPELTAERFVADPFTDSPGARMYRTGDLARIRSDGELEFLGRSDSQIQVRGIRVEPGEVEAALRLTDGVRDAAVTGYRGRDGELGLAAYLVADDGAETPDEVLRGLLADRLPAHMVPSWIVWLPELPLTPNRKIDYTLLPRPADEVADPEGSLATDGDPLVAGICEAWQMILGRRPASRDLDFFSAGGTSLQGVRFGMELARRLHRPVPGGIVFKFRTIDAIADSLRESHT